MPLDRVWFSEIPVQNSRLWVFNRVFIPGLPGESSWVGGVRGRQKRQNFHSVDCQEKWNIHWIVYYIGYNIWGPALNRVPNQREYSWAGVSDFSVSGTAKLNDLQSTPPTGSTAHIVAHHVLPPCRLCVVSPFLHRTTESLEAGCTTCRVSHTESSYCTKLKQLVNRPSPEVLFSTTDFFSLGEFFVMYVKGMTHL